MSITADVVGASEVTGTVAESDSGAVSVDLRAMGRACRAAAKFLAASSTEVRNGALLALAAGLRDDADSILAANAEDVAAANAGGIDEHVTERLVLDESRLSDMAAAVESIAALDDPVGEELSEYVAPNGLRIRRVRTALGVIGLICESRPNVTIDASALCIKSGNGLLVRGGREAIRTNLALADLVQASLRSAGLPADSVQCIASTDRALVAEMLQMDDCIDLLIPRGGAELVRRVAAEARMPSVTGGIGVCHTYVDSAADVEMASEVVYNAKVQRHTVCNALDTLLVHEKVAGALLHDLADRFGAAGVEIRAGDRAWALLGPKRSAVAVVRAKPGDFGTEFLAKVIAVKVVGDLQEALDHIAEYGSGHSEAIVSEDASAVARFLNEVDASAVFANASTRFNDGGEFGLGAEVAISTNKLHARGPMGMREIMSYKWVVEGEGQVRS